MGHVEIRDGVKISQGSGHYHQEADNVGSKGCGGIGNRLNGNTDGHLLVDDGFIRGARFLVHQIRVAFFRSQRQCRSAI